MLSALRGADSQNELFNPEARHVEKRSERHLFPSRGPILSTVDLPRTQLTLPPPLCSSFSDRRLLHPSNMIVRTYSCALSSRPTKAQLSRLLDLAAGRGAEVAPGAPAPGPRRASPAAAAAASFSLRVSIRKGENREVRRLMESAELRLRNLKRVAFGGCRLPRNLPPGAARQLRPEEAWGALARGVGEARAYAREMARQEDGGWRDDEWDDSGIEAWS